MGSVSYISVDEAVAAIKYLGKRRDRVRLTDVLGYLRGQRSGTTIDNRMVDRALQRARKDDRIKFDSKTGWILK